ncbi:MAG: hypothetical protein QXP70_00040 [Methanomassiliicoccales archaeon]
MTEATDGRIAGRTLADGSITWSHKFDINVVFKPPEDDQRCDKCGGELIKHDGKWHAVDVVKGRYYCERCSEGGS